MLDYFPDSVLTKFLDNSGRSLEWMTEERDFAPTLKG